MSSSDPVSTISHVLTNAHQLYEDYILPRLPSPFQSISDGISTIATPIIQSGDVVSIAAFLLCFYLTLRIADYLRRSLMSWIWFMLKIGMVLVLIQVVIYVQAYGWQKALKDASWIGGIVWGFVDEAMQQSKQDKRAGSAAYGGGKKWNASGGRQQAPMGVRPGRRTGGWT